MDRDAFEDLLLCDRRGMSRGKQWEKRGCEMPCCKSLLVEIFLTSADCVEGGLAHGEFLVKSWGGVVADVGIDVEVDFNADVAA